MCYRCVWTAALAALAFSRFAQAGVIYQNDFETPATQFDSLTAGGTLGSLSTWSLPTDSGGIASVNQSTWLGRLGLSVTKSSSVAEMVTLSLTGLIAGEQYNVAFDLFIGGSWDGSVGCCGPDRWRAIATSGALTTPLVDATFSNCAPCGAGGPQTYTDATPLAGLGGSTHPPETGADFSFDTQPSPYTLDYGLYWFGHGAGNPSLSFIAGASTATLLFERGPGPSNLDSADEYWGLDNISVTGQSAAPEPGLMVLGGLALIWMARRRR
jgi:MYXO-CTERM domain-containing protein